MKVILLRRRRRFFFARFLSGLLIAALAAPSPAFALRPLAAGMEEENPVNDQLDHALREHPARLTLTAGSEEKYGIGAGFRMWRWGAGEVKVVIKRRFGRKGWVALRKPLLGLGALLKSKGEGRAEIQEVFRTLAKAAGFMSPAQLEKLVSLVNRLVEEGVKPAHLFGWMRFVSVLVEIGQTSPNGEGASQEMLEALERFIAGWEMSQPDQKERMRRTISSGYRVFGEEQMRRLPGGFVAALDFLAKFGKAVPLQTNWDSLTQKLFPQGASEAIRAGIMGREYKIQEVVLEDSSGVVSPSIRLSFTGQVEPSRTGRPREWETLAAPVPADTLDSLGRELLETWADTKKRGFFYLDPLVKNAQRAAPFLTRVPPSLLSAQHVGPANRDLLATIARELEQQLWLPSERILRLQWGAQGPVLSTYGIVKSSWERRPDYLGMPRWRAQIRLVSGPTAEFGEAIGGVAFTDSEGAKSPPRELYGGLVHGDEDWYGDPFARRLQKMLRPPAPLVSESEFVDLYVQATTDEEDAHAEATLYAGAKFQRDMLFGLSWAETICEAVLQNDGFIRRSYWQNDTQRDDATGRRAIVELEARTKGIVAQMKEELQAHRPHLAYAALLSYLFLEVEDKLAMEGPERDEQKEYLLAAEYFLRALAHSLLQEGILEETPGLQPLLDPRAPIEMDLLLQFMGELLDLVEGEQGWADLDRVAGQWLEWLEKVYASNFLTDDQRRQALSVEPTAGPPADSQRAGMEEGPVEGMGLEEAQVEALRERMPERLEAVISAEELFESAHRVHDPAIMTDRVAALIHPELLPPDWRPKDFLEPPFELREMQRNLRGIYGWPEEVKLRIDPWSEEAEAAYREQGYRIVRIARDEKDETQDPISKEGMLLILSRAVASGLPVFPVNVPAYNLKLKNFSIDADEIRSTLTRLYA